MALQTVVSAVHRLIGNILHLFNMSDGTVGNTLRLDNNEGIFSFTEEPSVLIARIVDGDDEPGASEGSVSHVDVTDYFYHAVDNSVTQVPGTGLPAPTSSTFNDNILPQRMYYNPLTRKLFYVTSERDVVLFTLNSPD